MLHAILHTSLLRWLAVIAAVVPAAALAAERVPPAAAR
jgi:hypothetical protein